MVLCLCVPFAILSFQLAAGLELSFKSAVRIEGPVRVAIYSFRFLVAMAAIGDVKLVLAGGITGARRIGRHLWRMCLGLTFAAGSASTRFSGERALNRRIRLLFKRSILRDAGLSERRCTLTEVMTLNV